MKSKFPILLKKFYDADVITENSITDWYEKKKGPKKMDKDDVAFFKKKAKPFVEWLQYVAWVACGSGVFGGWGWRTRGAAAPGGSPA